MALIDQQNKINEMWRKIPDQVDEASENIINLEDIRDELQEQATAVEDAVLSVAEADAIVIIETIILPLYPLGYVLYGPTFGTIDYSTGNITDWAIWENITPVPPPILPPVPTIVYSYTPGDYPDLDQLVSDYDYGNDLLTKPLSTSGTYGLYENIDQLDTGLNVLNANKNAIAGGEDVFSRYLP